MPLIKIPKGWRLPESEVTPEDVYMNRRKFLKALGFSGLGAWSLFAGCVERSSEAEAQESGLKAVRRSIPEPSPPYPVSRNPEFKVQRPITTEDVAASYNNFYEFTTDKDEVWKLAEKFKTRPWEIEVTGHVHKKRTFDMDDLIKMFPLEERVYRFRCVEAWAMVVPWTGFPFKNFIEEVQPTPDAKYVRMVSFHRPDQAMGQRMQGGYPWPYYEGLTMDEATNELTLMVTGIYGHALPNQHGAPVRLITPWKYGYKSIKSIVKIEFVSEQPPTFWNDLAPNEYGFFSNVNPNVPHPRWSQATERIIDTDERVPTLLYNGYEEYVAHLYG
ncbi:protein-methionine-sulfoxide reductase catalytic subunit MsrP [candidate division KSB1 bacterium]|nr:protein-methionine-sulfoxide reductase catalytic subunit MsrP [candidate division KSB1 bacterium]NIR72034.1 protein-methionine-sulfoxide reductase catalytic subunit MsrP [candidate division KSB1 bacterium]NIS25975.1 protein-methionine-sulfoxide reductase catalytic subunit MsrP [candidate division KSB1 bacterium]NIT74946.1 protein-methionine-sulfoxide reductase catalytic subunit MsrP [candidate division KSB1 bacterium]NIU28730.1 protein-methionine-sulfoxide reductase catalytic subunit MsrP [c